MIVYISIPMSGKDLNVQRSRANRWQQYLEKKGYKVINPFIIGDLVDLEHSKKRFPKPTYEQYLQYDLDIMEMCTHIFLCDGWANSKGCLTEVEKAMATNMKFLFERIIKIE